MMQLQALEEGTAGTSLMQSGRSVMPTMGTGLVDSDMTDGLVDVFAALEDEFDDAAVQAQQSPHFKKPATQGASTDLQNINPALILNHGENPCLYVETLLVIAIFALGANAYKWVSKSPKPIQSVGTAEAPVPEAAKAEPAAVILGGSKNFPALEEAVRTGDEVKCLELLKQGGRRAVHQEDACGCTALHVAAHCGSASMARLLLDNGAKVDACEAWDETPLHVAARTGSVEVSELLLDRGANVDAANAHSFTPLLLAGHAKQEAVCELLLSRGAGAGGVADTELPPIVNALIFHRMFEGAVPCSAADVLSDGSEAEGAAVMIDEDEFDQ